MIAAVERKRDDMLSVYQLKPRFQALLRPRVTRLAAAGVTANQVTLAAAIGSVALGALVAWLAEYRPLFLLIALWFPARMALNAVDGMLARDFAQKSRLGAYLNELSDVVSDAALYFPFAMIAPFGPASVVTVIVLANTSEFAGALGPMIGAERQYQGPMGKSDRAVVFGLLAFWVGLTAPLPGWLWWLMPLVAALLAWTIVNRIRGGLRSVERA
jgi:CDP-diacylglycerol--glycerol-3-phosphate 3-phosphatidyltransferase